MTDQPQTPPARSGSDLATLEKMVVLPRPPRSVLWRQAIQGSVGLGPTDWKVVAVLEYSSEEAQALLAGLERAQGPAASLAEETWLAEPMRAALEKADAYEASAFLRPPLTHGTVYFLPQSNTFVLALFTC